MTLANMTAQETLQHNTDYCRHIADELDLVALGRLYECPYCAHDIDLEELDPVEQEALENGEELECPSCGHAVEFEQVDALQWLEGVLDIEYTVSSNMEYRGANVCVAFGGPSVYVDTRHGRVNLYWWGDSASSNLSGAACDALDEALHDLYECHRY